MERKKVGLLVIGMLTCIFVGAGIERVRVALSTFEPVAESAAIVVDHQAPLAATPRTVVLKDDSDAAALRKKVAELEKSLADRDAAIAKLSQKPKEGQAQAERPQRQSFSDRMEQLKKDNPEQYAEMQKRREDFRQTMEQKAQDRADFIAAVDTKNMNDAQKENHAKLLETVAHVNELMAQMSQPGVERTPEMRTEMGEAVGALGDLYSQERRFLLEETGRSVGYQDSQASEFADQMQSIIDNTTMPNFGRRGGGFGGQQLPVPPAPKTGQ